MPDVKGYALPGRPQLTPWQSIPTFIRFVAWVWAWVLFLAVIGFLIGFVIGLANA